MQRTKHVAAVTLRLAFDVWREAASSKKHKEVARVESGRVNDFQHKYNKLQRRTGVNDRSYNSEWGCHAQELDDKQKDVVRLKGLNADLEEK
eukprot:627492-Pyramimonas_sp.AAC.1